MRIKLAVKDFVNGIYSGIPLCCAWYFTKEVFKGVDGVGYDTFLRRNPYKTFNDYCAEDSPNYVRCDKCHEKDHRVKIKQNGVLLCTRKDHKGTVRIYS